jgi:hypothetical protein
MYELGAVGGVQASAEVPAFRYAAPAASLQSGSPSASCSLRIIFFGVAPVNLPRYTIEEVQSGLLFYGVTSAEGSINAEKSVPRIGYNLVSFFVFPPGDTSILPPYFENTKKNADDLFFEPHLRVPYPFSTL